MNNGLSIQNLCFRGVIFPKAMVNAYAEFDSFTCDFEFGKSYLLASQDGNTVWALTWIIGGYLQAQSGELQLNGQPFPMKQRLQDVWLVRRSEIRGFLGRHLTLQQQIQHGLKMAKQPYLKSEQEVIEHFHLTPERFTRLMRQFSKEGYRASCAAGFVNGRRIFFFPDMQLYPTYSDMLEEHIELWLRYIVKLLTGYGAIVLIPARITSHTVETLCDVIVPVT